MSDQKGLCALCGIQATSMCQRCFECYCSVNCQIEDWAKHKLICIPMPTLIPLQSLKPKKVSVNARLERTNFVNNSMEIHQRPGHRNFPLRKPQWYNQNDSHSESEVAINCNLRKIEQKIPLSPPKDESVRSHQPNRASNNWRLTSNGQNDMPRMVKYDNNNDMPSHGHNNNNKDLNNKSEGVFTSNGNSIDFSLKLRNNGSKEDSVSLNVDEIIDRLDDVLSNTSEKTNKSRKAWRSHFPTQKDKYFEVIVQYVSESDPNLIWVIDASYETACTALLKEINKNIKAETDPCPEGMIFVGDVVAAPFLGLYYRAIILEEKNPLNEVGIRLLDYGNDFYINVNRLKPPITAMKNLNAYAFCIRYNGKAVDIGDSLKIKIIGNENNDVYKVEEENNIKEELLKDMNIKIVNVFQKVHAIAIVEQKEIADQLTKMRQVLAEDTEDKFKLALPPVEGSFIVGKTSTHWERGFLLSSYESNCVMYCVDIGQIELLNEVKSVPSDFKNIPRQALLFTIEKEANLEKYRDDGNMLQLKPITNDEATNYDLYCGSNKLAGSVKVSKDWNGCFADISIDYWPAGPKPRDEIQITHVHSHSEIYICKHDKVEIYSKIFDTKGQIAGMTEATKDKIVLGPNQNRFVRCKILDKLRNEILLLDLDSGHSFKAEERQIKEADNFVRYAPVFVTKATLLHLNKINPCTLNKAVPLLKSCIKERKKFTISYMKNEVELFIDANNSYNKQLISLLFEEIMKTEENNNNNLKEIEKLQDDVKKNVKDNVKSENIFQINDIELIPIPTGQSVQILVLDNSMIADGIITGCAFNPELLTKFQTTYAENIMKFCIDPSNPQEYSPREYELCFSLYEEDNQWYRAVCLKKVSDDEFLMLFLDYGNTTTKTKKDLRKITKDYLYPTPANTCEIDGLPQAMSEELLKSIKSIVHTDALLKVKNVKKDDESYLITIDEIKNLLP